MILADDGDDVARRSCLWCSLRPCFLFSLLVCFVCGVLISLVLFRTTGTKESSHFNTKETNTKAMSALPGTAALSIGKTNKYLYIYIYVYVPI